MSGLSLYFGTDLPEAAWANGLRGVDVVLEPYHPLAKYGGFAETFPDARRWIYVNPTSVDPWILERSDAPPPLSGVDARWNLPRIDLSQSAGMEWAVREALEAHELDGGSAHGLFIDDLDRLLPDEAELAMEFIVRVGLGARREVRWFLNRGFQLWPRVEALDAVLLEDITPQIAAHAPVSEIRWLRDVVIEGSRAVRRRGARVHSIGYRDQEATLAERSPDEKLAADLTEVVDSVTTGAERALADWRTSNT